MMASVRNLYLAQGDSPGKFDRNEQISFQGEANGLDYNIINSP